MGKMSPEAIKRYRQLQRDIHATTKGGQQNMGKQVSKRAAMVQALQELGRDASLDDLQAYMKEHFQLSMSRGMASSYKSDINKTLSDEPPAEEEEETESEAESGGFGTFTVGDLETLQELVGRVPVDELKRIIDILAKR